MNQPAYILHGTISDSRAELIMQTGFTSEEGRATVSTDLLLAFEMATMPERQGWSNYPAAPSEGTAGRLLVMNIPAELHVGYAYGTDITIDDEHRFVSGNPYRYRYSRRQLALYGSVTAQTEALLVEPNNVVMSLVPSFEMGAKFIELHQRTKQLEQVDIDELSQRILAMVNSDPANYIAPNINALEAIKNLLVNTVETTIVNLFRNLLIEVKSALGYQMDWPETDLPDNPASPELVYEKLGRLWWISHQPGFDIGEAHLNRYIKDATQRLLRMLLASQGGYGR